MSLIELPLFSGASLNGTIEAEAWMGPSKEELEVESPLRGERRGDIPIYPRIFPDHPGIGPTKQGHKASFARIVHKAGSARIVHKAGFARSSVCWSH